MSHRQTLQPVAQPAGLPEECGPVVVTRPAAWCPTEIARARRYAEAGGAVVVPVADRPSSDEAGVMAGWLDLLGVTRGPDLPAAEVVVEPVPHTVTRNIVPTVLDLGSAPHDARRLRTAAMTTVEAIPVLTTPLGLQDHTLVSERPMGSGRVVGVAVPGWLDLPAVHAVRRVVDRLARQAYDSAATTSLGLGIVGYGQHGGMGWLHGRACGEVEGLHLAAIAELDQHRLSDASERFPEASPHTRIESLLADDSVDVVVVATPPSTHYELTCRVIEAGRHVVVEKPLCFTAAEADDLIGRAASAGVTLTVHQNRRWDADYRAISRLIRSGRLGEVFNIETFVGSFEHPCTLWHSDREVSGGRLYDWGAHLIDQILQLFGGAAPTVVAATGHKRVWHDVTNLDQVRVRMRFADGREAEFLDSDVLAVRRPKYLVQGTRGTVVGEYQPVVEERVTADHGYQLTEHHHAEGPARLRFAEHHTGWGLQDTVVPGLPAASFPFHRALADHLQLGDAVPVDPAGVRTVIAVLEAATVSARDGGRPVELVEPSGDQ